MVLGFISAKTFFAHSWTALIPWGIAGLAVGLASKNRKSALWNGAIYGFFLPMSFTIFGFQGNNGSVPALLLLAIILGVIGAGCGMVLSLTGKSVRRERMRRFDI